MDCISKYNNQTIILIEENMGGYLCITGVDNNFFDKIIKTLAIKMVSLRNQIGKPHSGKNILSTYI